MAIPGQHEYKSDASLDRWRGRVDGFISTTEAQIKALFDSHRVTNDKIDATSEKIEAKLLTTKEELSDRLGKAKDALTGDVQIVSNKLTGLTAKIAVVAAFASFIGTGIMGVFIAVIVKALVK